ncbi:MAG: EAL domain-containing protein [Thiobacillus sp.]
MNDIQTTIHVDDPADCPTTVLLIEDEPADARLIQDALASTVDSAFRVEWVTRLSDALERLASERFEVVLLDLSLPDGKGLEAFDQVLQAAPDSLILVLSGLTDEETAREAMARGAHDYFSKGHVDAHWLPRALRYVMERKTAQGALACSEERFRAMNDASPLGIFVSDAEGSCIYTNAAYQTISGLTLEQTLGTNWSTAIHPEDRERVLAEWRDAARGQAPFLTEFRFLQKDDSIVWTRVNSAAMFDGKKSFGRVQTVEDISGRKSAELVLQEAEAALFEEKERAQVTLNSIGDAVLTTDLSGKVTYLNPVAEAMTGWFCTEALGRPISEIFTILDGTTRQAAANPMQRAMTDNETVGLGTNCVLVRRDGFESAIEDSAAPIHDRDGEVTGAVIVFRDVSESRAMALEMAHLAQHDFLTSLPNRLLLTERFSHTIRMAQRNTKQVGLMFLDLDNFKHINDSLGHAIGDQLLQSVANRLVACVRTTDTVCRQGGDEFVILLAEIGQPQDAAQVAETLRAALGMPHLIDGHELHVTLSIGISVFPDDGTNVDALMQNADTAMYHAKAGGRDNYQFFRADMNARAVRRLFVETSLRRALRQGEFLLHYQPKINLASGAMTGAEALIRWQDPDLGLVYPAQFVPIAEENGLIVPVGRWVLREACRQVQAWLDAGLPAVPVSVNISAVEFRHEGFVEGVALILKETGLAPHYLELELTESILMHDVESSTSMLEAFKAMGVQLAIDDFGTGYSSLSYLKRFPISTLKIDQSFVRDIATDADDASIVSAVIGMGKNLKQRVIAEGVETQAQLALLQARHCDEGQGYHFSHPVSAEDFARLLDTGN